MHYRAMRKLCQEWHNIMHAQSQLGIKLEAEMDRQVRKARMAGKQDSEYELSLAFSRDIERCKAGKISPEKALERLDVHLEAWVSGDPSYQGNPPEP